MAVGEKWEFNNRCRQNCQRILSWKLLTVNFVFT